MSEPFLILDNRLVAKHQARLPASCRALTHGQSCFETLRLYPGFRVFGFQDHITRLMRGAVKLGYEASLHGSMVSPENIPAQIRKLAVANGFDNREARIRIQLGRADSAGIRDSGSPGFFLMITCTGVSPESEPVRLMSTVRQRISAAALDASVKWSFYQPNIEELENAAAHGFDDVLMADRHGHVCETAVANIFFISRNEIITPELLSGALHGVTRNHVIRMLEHEKIPVYERKISFAEASEADAAFVTNAIKGIAPVVKLDDITFPADHKSVDKVMRLFSDWKKQHLKTLPA